MHHAGNCPVFQTTTPSNRDNVFNFSIDDLPELSKSRTWYENKLKLGTSMLPPKIDIRTTQDLPSFQPKYVQVKPKTNTNLTQPTQVKDHKNEQSIIPVSTSKNSSADLSNNQVINLINTPISSRNDNTAHLTQEKNLPPASNVSLPDSRSTQEIPNGTQIVHTTMNDPHTKHPIGGKTPLNVQNVTSNNTPIDKDTVTDLNTTAIIEEKASSNDQNLITNKLEINLVCSSNSNADERNKTKIKESSTYMSPPLLRSKTTTLTDV